MTEVFVYVFDLFIPIDLTRREILEAFRVDKLKPFELVREIVEGHGVKKVRSVDFYDAIFRGEEFLIEYLVDFANGRVAVRVIGSDDPRRMLREYYEYIKTSK